MQNPSENVADNEYINNDDKFFPQKEEIFNAVKSN